MTSLYFAKLTKVDGVTFGVTFIYLVNFSLVKVPLHHRRHFFRRAVLDGGGVDFGRGNRHGYFVCGAGRGRIALPRLWRGRAVALSLRASFYRFRRGGAMKARVFGAKAGDGGCARRVGRSCWWGYRRRWTIRAAPVLVCSAADMDADPAPLRMR